MIIGLTGGIATGKSLVAEMLKEMGAKIIDTDQLSREITEVGSPVWYEILGVWGKEILNPDNTINRKKLAEIVFSNPLELKKLNQITHPKIFEKLKEKIKNYTEKDIVVVVIPLLIETGTQDFVDEVWVVVASEENQIKRLIERDNMSKEEAILRIKTQLPNEEKIKYAHRVIENNSTIEFLKEQVKYCFEELKKKYNI
jgi:dephospho-CoA kinase